MDSKNVLRALRKDSWYIARTRESHHHLCVTQRKRGFYRFHRRKDMPMGILKSIEKQTGIKLA